MNIHHPLVSVIIVNFNGGELLTECVRSVLGSTVPVEVVVSDNGSIDGSILFLEKEIQDPRLLIVSNGCNLGFAAGANRVLDRTKGEYILFLNPDTLIRPDTLKEMLSITAGRPETGMAGCLVRNLDGSEQAGCRRRIPTPWRSMVRVLRLNRIFPNNPKFECCLMHLMPLPDKPIEIEAISGAFMFVKRAALDEVGSFDEHYFLHCEDLDLCMRFRQQGWKILFVPDIEITHAKGACSNTRPIRVEWHKHCGMVRFYNKFFRKQYPLPLMGLVFVAVMVRFLIIASITFVRRALT